MIDELHVSNLALIEDAVLRPAPGLTVLSGETGAGKTALLSACKLLAGDRADASLVRDGAPEAVVEARFTVVERDGGEEGADGSDELVCRRRIGADGRSRCTVDGAMATVGSMAAAVSPLLQIYGQHEHQELFSPAVHVGYLDRWAGRECLAALAAYRDALEGANDAGRALAEAERAASASATEVEVARFIIGEIDRVDPHQGEEDELLAQLPALQHAEELASGAAEALRALRDDSGAADALAAASDQVARLAGIDPALEGISSVLADALAAVEDAASDLRAYRDGVEFNPQLLEEVQGRLAELAGVKRKYGPSLEDVLARRDEARETVEGVEDSSARLAAARARRDEAEGLLADAAKRLTQLRSDAMDGFCSALGDAVADLQMQGASFAFSATELPRESWNALGPARIELLYSPGTGLEPRPLAKIASGGELSRVMLALKGEVGLDDTGQTLVFDEIDAGVGGTAAVAVGRRLAALAQRHQVIVVTHLAQIAVNAQLQVVVSKAAGQDGRPVTSLRPVEGEERVAEVARMLSGDVDESSLDHARALLS